MGSGTNRQWLLRHRPGGAFTDDHVEVVEGPMPRPSAGQALIRVDYLSMDPTIRGWMQHDTYMPRIAIGEVVRGLGIGTVIASHNERYPEGALVSGLTGWQQWTIADDGDARFQVLPDGTDPLDAVGLFGPTGLAAYFGMLDVGKPSDGDTVVVSGAAGATGSVAGQIARLHGCRVVGIAGGPDKCASLVDELGFDAAIDYRSEQVGNRLRETCTDGIDVYFDNVGGPILEAALGNLATGARVVLCGAISQYDGGPASGPRNYMQLVVRRARMEGFLVFDYAARYGEAIADLARWAADGKIVHEVDVVEGFESVPAAFRRLFTGDKRGKNAVRLT